MVNLSRKIKVGIVLLIVVIIVIVILVAVFSFFMLLLPIAVLLFLIGILWRFLYKLKPAHQPSSVHPKPKHENKEVIDVDYKVK